jgi:hypothetical protein
LRAYITSWGNSLYASKVLALLLCSLLLSFVRCKKTTNEVSSHSQGTASPSTAKFDACALITKEQTEAVQGSPITDTNSSRQSGKGLLVSQCSYATRDSAKSESLTVTQGDPASPARGNAKDFWNKTFGRYRGEQKGHDRDKEQTEAEGARGEREKSAPPKTINGIGDDAFWSVARFGGALYVLKKRFLHSHQRRI